MLQNSDCHRCSIKKTRGRRKRNNLPGRSRRSWTRPAPSSASCAATTVPSMTSTRNSGPSTMMSIPTTPTSIPDRPGSSSPGTGTAASYTRSAPRSFMSPATTRSMSTASTSTSRTAGTTRASLPCPPSSTHITTPPSYRS